MSAFPQTLHSLEADQDATKFSRAFLGAWDHGLPRAAEVADLRLSLGEQAVLMLDESRLAELVATRAPCDACLLSWPSGMKLRPPLALSGARRTARRARSRRSARSSRTG